MGLENIPMGVAIKALDGKMLTSSVPYLYDIASGATLHKSPFMRMGYNSAVATTRETIWSAGGDYVFPTAEMGMEVVSGDNTQDIGTVIKGDETGDSVVSDAGGTTTTLVDADVDFTGATAVAAGDCVILDPHGTPSFGFVTTVAAHVLTVERGFSGGVTGALKPYAVVDKSPYTGAQAVGIQYLDGDYVEHEEIVVLNGTTPVATVNDDMFRINYFYVIAAGSDGVATGNLTVRHLSDTPVYSHISTTYARSRSLIYTIPADKTLYLTSLTVGASTPAAANFQTVRASLMANMEPELQVYSGSVLHYIAEVLVTNDTVDLTLELPVKVPEKIDMLLKAKGIPDFAGGVAAVARGWLED